MGIYTDEQARRDGGEYSLLRREQPRDLEQALAEYAVKAQTGSREMETANRLFNHMTPAAQHRVRCKVDALRGSRGTRQEPVR